LSPLTKVLVVLVTVLSILELGLFVAYSSKHTRLNEQVSTLNSQLTAAQVLNRGHQAEINAAQARQTETVSGLNAKISDLTKSLILAQTAQRGAEDAVQAEKVRNDKTEQAIARLTASAQQDAVLRGALIGELATARSEVVDLRTKGVELLEANNELTSSLNRAFSQ